MCSTTPPWRARTPTVMVNGGIVAVGVYRGRVGGVGGLVE